MRRGTVQSLIEYAVGVGVKHLTDVRICGIDVCLVRDVDGVLKGVSVIIGGSHIQRESLVAASSERVVTAPKENRLVVESLNDGLCVGGVYI